MTVRMFEVGGCVRDELLGVKSKDIDFSVEAASFEAMKEFLVSEGFKIFVENPEFFTIRAKFPKDSNRGGLTADFVLARKEGSYSDGRRPDEVMAGTIFDDLARRDFTVNAIAKAEDGTLIDPFGGATDVMLGVLRCVGRAEDRMREDSLRALRALRFSVTKGFVIDSELWSVLESDWLPPLLASTSQERQREELFKMFKADTEKSFVLLANLPGIRRAVLKDGLWLKPTMEQ